MVDRRGALPLKVWSECVRCPKHDACDEIAMVRTLRDVAVSDVPVEKGVQLPVLSESIRAIDREARQNT